MDEHKTSPVKRCRNMSACSDEWVNNHMPYYYTVQRLRKK